MEIFNLFRALFNTNSRPDLNGGDMLQNKGVTTPMAKKKSSVSASTTSKYQADIDAIEKSLGKLTDGMTIDMTLQEILAICPRSRRRIESYQGLRAELGRRNITLNLKSRKTK